MVSNKEMDCILMVWFVMSAISTVGCQVNSSQGEIYLENGGICDTGRFECYSVNVQGDNFTGSDDLTCHLHHTDYKCLDPDKGCTKHKVVLAEYGYHIVLAKFINSTTVICETGAEAYYISVNNYVYSYTLQSPQALYLPYNSLCQTCNAETATCVSTSNQMKKYCHFENKCTDLDEINPKYRCQKCGTAADNGTLIWEDVMSVDCGYAVLPAWSIVLLVIAAIALIVVIGFLVHACFFKSGDASTYNRVLENGATTSDATSSDPVEPNPQT